MGKIVMLMIPTLQDNLLPTALYNSHHLLAHLDLSLAPEESIPQHKGLMKIMLWKCWGAHNQEFRRNLRFLLTWNNPSIMCLTETKMADHSELLMEFNYTDLIQVATQGQSEGIVIPWRAHELVINTVAITSQEIHTSVKLNKSPSWLLSLVYGSNNFTDRRIIWNNLPTVHEHYNCAWLLCGDFNEVFTSKENFCGAPINLKKPPFSINALIILK